MTKRRVTIEYDYDGSVHLVTYHRPGKENVHYFSLDNTTLQQIRSWMTIQDNIPTTQDWIAPPAPAQISDALSHFGYLPAPSMTINTIPPMQWHSLDATWASPYPEDTPEVSF